ncbi:MAG: FG-GAP-like repeat-containing protein, partial [Chitinophagales bacterium]
TAPYTIPTWSDYDNDGDIDCFIGSGPANGTVAKDYLFKNQLKETGIPNYFTKITTAPIGTDLLDGQIWNWIDYDNDGDLDAYVTNYIGTSGTGMPNNLYRNDDGLFVKMTSAEVGPIVSDNDASLASVWEDFDNDGDLDCFVTNDGITECKYYENNNGVFTDINSEPVTDITAVFYGAAAGDYDRDGDVDLFVVGTAGGKALYNNNSATNGNNWMQIKLTGTGSLILNGSNRSAIGAIVRVKAIIDGNVVWQMREISAQNSFNSMNSLDAEFGLGDASIIDSIIITWPSGIVDSCAALPVNQFYTITEGNCPEAVKINQPEMIVQNLMIIPNPAQDVIQVDLNVIHAGNGVIRVTDTAGKTVLEQNTGNLASGQQSVFVKINLLPQGIYTCSIILDGQTISATFTKY